jgi:hypothetical protein
VVLQNHFDSVATSATLTIPELEQSEAAVLNTLVSVHSSAELRIRDCNVHCLVLQRAR